MDYKVQNGRLLVRKNGRLSVERAPLYVKDGVICRIGEAGAEFDSGFEVLNAEDRLVMPGLINMHTHLYMTVLRNYADDLNFAEWLFGRIEPVENAMTPEEAYWSSMLGAMEMIQTGTTCFVDMHMFPGQSARAAAESGLRAYVGRGLVGEDLYTDGASRFAEFRAEAAEFSSDRVRVLLSPHAIYTCSEKLLTQVAEEARRGGYLKQIHLSESEQERKDCLAKYGKTPVAFLDEIGFLDDNTVLAHCVKLDDGDLRILRQSGASAVTNPASNAKLGNGFAPVCELCEAGVNVCIGTDGAASNNTLNLFREMNLLSLLQKGRMGDSTVLPAETIVDMATCNAAKALHRQDELGVIREGAAADLIFIDLNAVSMLPNNNVISALCSSASGAEVDSVMVNGAFLMKNREFLTVDRERVLYEVKKYTRKLI